jgi:putative glycerol-1-phosphate prenyltransferase
MIVLDSILKLKKQEKKGIAFLIDPDKANEEQLNKISQLAEKLEISFFLVGGSLITSGDLTLTLQALKSKTKLPLILFPGSPSQISDEADGILFLSLLSSRNPEMLIGQQVIAAPYLKMTSLEIISTAYLLIESGAQTTASYMSNSNPIPSNKAEIAEATALAGEYLGMRLIYLDAGSGAKNPVPANMISKVASSCTQPIIVGGGINSKEKIESAYQAGADFIVIGDAIEKGSSFINELDSLKHYWT